MRSLAKVAMAAAGLPVVLVSCSPTKAEIGQVRWSSSSYLTSVAARVPVPPCPLVRDTAERLVGKNLPHFSMRLTNGSTIDSKSISGKPVLIGFWSSWCEPCRPAIEAIDEWQKTFAKDGLIIIAADGFEDATSNKVAADYSKRFAKGVAVTVGNDQIMKDWGVQGTPCTILVGKDGVVTHVEDRWGPQTKVLLSKRIGELVR